MQFLLFVVIVFILGVILYAKKEVLSVRHKVTLLGLILLTIITGALYEWQLSQKSAQNRESVNAFKQGKTLLCAGKEINNQSFIFVSGTLSFIPSDSNKNDKGVVIDIVTCKLK